jgi:hypothetical protein
MVEAGILAPIFAMMMMMTAYLMGTYETKYRTIMMSRYATWSYASNHCTADEFNPITDDLPTGIKLGALSPTTGDSVTQQQDSTGGSGGTSWTNAAEGSQSGSSATGSMFMAKGTSTMTWDFSPTYKFNGGSAKQITTESQTVCNAKTYNTDPSNWFPKGNPLK